MHWYQLKYDIRVDTCVKLMMYHIGQRVMRAIDKECINYH